MAKVLVVYYSRTGATAKVAKAIAAELAADVEEIREAKPRAGVFGFIRSAIEASRRKTPVILQAVRDPADYDVVILGFPVWANEMASPMRSYLTREKSKLGQVAVFCTLGGSGGDAAIQSVAALCGRTPVAMLAVTTADLASNHWRERVHAFTQSIA